MPTTQGRKPDPDRQPQTVRKHPDEYQRDLNPDHMAGQNISPVGDTEAGTRRTAYDAKDLHRSLGDAFRDDELKQIPVLRSGERLQQGATYIDLSESRPREFTAMGDMAAGPPHWYVAKDQVPYVIWNRLIGEPKPGQEGPGTGS